LADGHCGLSVIDLVSMTKPESSKKRDELPPPHRADSVTRIAEFIIGLVEGRTRGNPASSDLKFAAHDAAAHQSVMTFLRIVIMLWRIDGA
jgi:hypothetical protein